MLADTNDFPPHVVARSAEDPATACESQCFCIFYVTKEQLDEFLVKKL